MSTVRRVLDGARTGHRRRLAEEAKKRVTGGLLVQAESKRSGLLVTRSRNMVYGGVRVAEIWVRKGRWCVSVVCAAVCAGGKLRSGSRGFSTPVLVGSCLAAGPFSAVGSCSSLGSCSTVGSCSSVVMLGGDGLRSGVVTSRHQMVHGLTENGTELGGYGARVGGRSAEARWLRFHSRVFAAFKRVCDG